MGGPPPPVAGVPPLVHELIDGGQAPAVDEPVRVDDQVGQVERPAVAPADLVYMLIHRVGLAEGAVAAMAKEDALARLHQYWIEGT